MSANGAICDLFVIGGGINGVAIARDAAGRGLKVSLVEMNDLASGTSSASTKLLHGGLRYLDYLEFGLVKKALHERNLLLQNMPHIAKPMRFVIPFDPDLVHNTATASAKLLRFVTPFSKGRRPAWVMRLALYLYDCLGGKSLFPKSKKFRLKGTDEGRVLLPKFSYAFEYSDAFVDDARLVVLNAKSAKSLGAQILTRHKVIAIMRQMDMWLITVLDTRTGKEKLFRARTLVNASGPWLEETLTKTLGMKATEPFRLVRGSHIVTKRLYDHDKAYFLQGNDGRIVFTIPYEDDFTLIGTTENAADNPDMAPVCTDADADYLRRHVSRYFQIPITRDDIVWRYSGLRPLHEEEDTAASAASRDYLLKLDKDQGAPFLTVYGGKITTHRKLAEEAISILGSVISIDKKSWTIKAPLSGGYFEPHTRKFLLNQIEEQFPLLGNSWARRVLSAYGNDVFEIFGDGLDVGRDFGAGLYEAEVNWLLTHEFAQTAEDIIWRRTKLGLHKEKLQIVALEKYIAGFLNRK